MNLSSTARLHLILALAFAPVIAADAQDTAIPSQANPAPTTSDADVGLPDSEVLQRIDSELNYTVGPGWMINYRAARDKANAEKKDLLLLFTGSDWIDICKTFDTDVCNHDDFFKAASEHFVPVRLDFPKQEKQPDALKAQNQVLMGNYRVQGFPTVMLTDDTGRPYAVNGYQAVSATEYATILKAMTAVRARRDEKFEAAKTAQGLERAQLLADGIPSLPGNLAAWFYRPQLEQLISNDLQNKTGKAVHYQRLINDVDYSRTMAQLSRNVEWSRMLRLTDDYIRSNQLKDEELQHAMMNKIGVLQNQGKMQQMAQTLLEIVAIDPKTSTGEKAQGILDQLRVNNLQIDQLQNPSTDEAKP